MKHLTEVPSFRQAAEYLTEHLTEKRIEGLSLAGKVTAYSSDDDGVVPLEASEPSWVEVQNKHRIGSQNHVKTIARTLATEIRSQIGKLAEAKFD